MSEQGRLSAEQLDALRAYYDGSDATIQTLLAEIDRLTKQLEQMHEGWDAVVDAVGDSARYAALPQAVGGLVAEIDRLAALVRQLVDAAVETIRREKHRREDTCQLCGEPYYSARCTSSHAPTYPLATALAAAREQGFVPSGEGVPGIAEAAVADAREMYERTAPRIAPRPVD